MEEELGLRHNEVNRVDVVFITLTWLLFLTTVLCYHFASMSGVVIASASLVTTVKGGAKGVVYRWHFVFPRGKER